jgi:DNA-directed RNA polymerase sigma subunit (sigma70/sigma32)
MRELARDPRRLDARNAEIHRVYTAGGVSLRAVGRQFGLSVERVRQIVYRQERLRAWRERETQDA